MALIFNQDALNLIDQKWVRLGWNVTQAPFKGEIDIEELIVQTTLAVRLGDGRLLKWFLTWMKDYNDLVNKKRLLRLLKNADTAVLGAVLDIAMKQGADWNFHTITAKCKPFKTPQVLFTTMADVFTFIEQEKNNGLEEYRKWGLFCTLHEFYEDAKKTRIWVLQNNPQLALRALLGPNIRAEIIYCLLNNTKIAIMTLANTIGYAYSAVHKEVEILVKSGFLVQSTGRSHLLDLTPKTKKLLQVMGNG